MAGGCVAFVNCSPIIEIITILSAFFAAQIIDAIMIVSLIVVWILDLHAVVAIVVIILGHSWGGILGMIISILVTSTSNWKFVPPQLIKLSGRALHVHLNGLGTTYS